MIKIVCALIVVTLGVVSCAPQQQGRRLFDDLGTTTTEKPIVQIKRLINQQNRDGSYTYGFEADDGSFKIETRDNLGNVKGKYGYIDVNNELKIVDYSAGNGTGFDAQADFLPKPQQPVPVPEAPRSPPPRRQEARPQQSFRGAPEPQQQPAPQVSSDASGLSHFSDPNGVFQFSFPSPGQPAQAAPAGSIRSDGQYVPSFALEGFSDDADKDGFVDPLPTDGRVPVRGSRPGGNAGPAAAPPSFASVDFRGVPQQQQSFQPAPSFQAANDRPQFPQQEPPRFIPQAPQQPDQQFFNPAFAPRPRQPQAFPDFRGIPQQPQPQFQQQFLPQQQAPRFLQNASPVQGGAPIFQGGPEQPRLINPLSLQGRRPF